MFKKMLSQYGNGLDEYNGWFIETIDSPDDGGYYCLVIDDDGSDVAETKVFVAKADAIKEAKQLIDNDQVPMY